VQEEFYGCSDVSISLDGSGVVNPTAAPPVITTGAPAITTSTTATTTKFVSSVTGKCKNGDGYFADFESGCRNYYICQFTGTSYESVISQTCPSGLLFDNINKVCNYTNLVTCRP